MQEDNLNKVALTLDPDNQDSTVHTVPKMQSLIKSKDESENFSAGTIDEDMLTEEEKQIVEQFANEIDISNVDQTIKYGVAAQRNISAFSESILKKVKTYDLGEIGDSLKELTVAINATTEPEKKGFFGLFQKAKRSIESIKANYSKVENNVNRIEKDLEIHKNVLTQDVLMYQEMYELNIDYYKELTMYIIAGKKALSKAKEGELKELKKKAEITNKQEDAQAYKDFEDLCHRFEKRISDLEITRVISIQSAPQVRMLQNNDREMLDKLQSSLSNTIPLWRNQLVLSLGIEHSQRAIEAQSTLADKTNELLKKNAETLKMATINAAKEAERPIVEIETLKQCNSNLISSINEVIKIHEQGEQKRIKVQAELVRIEEELKQAMLDNMEKCR
jgi:uncharacterized protein YaaN involved in tellurite resistance